MQPLVSLTFTVSCVLISSLFSLDHCHVTLPGIPPLKSLCTNPTYRQPCCDSQWTTKSHNSLFIPSTYLSRWFLNTPLKYPKSQIKFFPLPWTLPTLSFLWTYGSSIFCHWQLPFNIYLYLCKSYLSWMVDSIRYFLHGFFIFSNPKWYVLLASCLLLFVSAYHFCCFKKNWGP